MRIDNKKRDELLAQLNGSENKPAAIYDMVANMMASEHEDLINSILSQAAVDRANASHDATRGFRPLSANEKKFYEALKKGPEEFYMSVKADQVNILPVETIDYTLNEVKKASGVTNLINFTPVGVKKWLFGSKTGTAAWGNLTDAITSELTATLTAQSMDAFKLSAFVVIPKAIRELEIGYVDTYVMAILKEAMEDGIVKGYLNGDGKTAPIGIMRQINSTDTDGTAKPKTAVVMKSFSPKDMAAVLKVLTHNGLRKVSEIAVICNPLDELDYVNPALYVDSIVAGYTKKSAVPVTVYSDVNVAQGSAVITMPGMYTMGFQSVKIDEYKETKALDDADLIIAKAYANGRAVDDDAAVVIDVTKLEEYKLPAHKASATTGA